MSAQFSVNHAEMGISPDVPLILQGNNVRDPADRLRLLGRVSVDEHGVAVCDNEEAGVSMRMAVARIVDDTAEQVGFTMDDDKLQLALPSDQPSQLGFFVGTNPRHDLGIALRVGEYPGTPLLTKKPAHYNATEEVLSGTLGTPYGGYEEIWAKQIDVYDELGIAWGGASNTSAQVHIKRSTYNASLRSKEEARSRPLVVSPSDTPAANPLTFQVLGYELGKAVNPWPTGRAMPDFVQTGIYTTTQGAYGETERQLTGHLLPAAVGKLAGAFEIEVSFSAS